MNLVFMGRTHAQAHSLTLITFDSTWLSLDLGFRVYGLGFSKNQIPKGLEHRVCCDFLILEISDLKL